MSADVLAAAIADHMAYRARGLYATTPERDPLDSIHVRSVLIEFWMGDLPREKLADELTFALAAGD